MEVAYLLQDPETEEDLSKELMASYCGENLSVLDDMQHTMGFPAQETDSYMSEFCILEKHQYKYKLVDRKYQEVDEEGAPVAVNNISSYYPDHLLENCPEENVANDSYFRKVESQLWCQSMEKESEAAETSDLQKAYTNFCEDPFDQNTWVLENTESDELQNVRGRSLEFSTSVTDKVFQNGHCPLVIENLYPGANDCENEMIWASGNVIGVSTPLESISNISELVAGKNSGDSPLYIEDVRKSHISRIAKTGHKLLNFEAGESALVTCKRMRKPPQRYIEGASQESSFLKRDRLTPTGADRNHLKETKSS